MKSNYGGARPWAGRKRGVGISFDIAKHCERMLIEMLKDDAIKQKAIKQVQSKLELTNERGYLYVIKSSGLVKIGFSSNWSKREKSYKTHTPNFKLIYLVQSELSFQLETEIHEMYKDNHVKGEWFDLSDGQVVDVITYCTSKTQ